MTRRLRRWFGKLELAKPEAEKQHRIRYAREQSKPNSTTPPHAQLVQMAHAHWVSHIVYVAAKLSLADHLANGPKSADEIAGKIGAHAPSVYRLMRTLANLGILTEDAKHCFALTALGDAPKTAGTRAA